VRSGGVTYGLAVQDRTRPDWCGKVRLGKAVREWRKARSGSIWSGRKCAEDWTGNKWHGKVGSGSLGQVRFHLVRFGWAGSLQRSVKA
jgi:hypothetical protein